MLCSCLFLVLLFAIVFLSNISVTVICLLLCLFDVVMSSCCVRVVMFDVIVLSLLFCVFRG